MRVIYIRSDSAGLNSEKDYEYTDEDVTESLFSTTPASEITAEKTTVFNSESTRSPICTFTYYFIAKIRAENILTVDFSSSSEVDPADNIINKVGLS